MKQLTIEEDIAKKTARVSELKPLLEALGCIEVNLTDVLYVYALKSESTYTRKNVVENVAQSLVHVGNIRGELEDDIERLESDIDSLTNCTPLIEWVEDRMGDSEVFYFTFREAAEELDMASSQIHDWVCSFAFNIPKWYVNQTDVDCTVTLCRKTEEEKE